uniref:Drosha ribonuclease III n=1 Tax=Oncorhynchus kisutch TaxID=8019 RepID=A0A8C7KW67_ONCKI
SWTCFFLLDWNDPKSQLQQFCLTLGTEATALSIPLSPLYNGAGQSHARTETVAVYFKEERIGCGKGPSIQQAVMEAAMDWLEKYKLFEEEQELKEMKRERERQQKVGDEPEESRK